ncbi:zinc ribbon domain-containing protein [Dolichospermum circinale CS-541/06]|nr:zinc ribbon domain-containing protein [Dolichospermum circinale]MDB9453056.1 zinc ribbon domain-containing protein [Dolichospermum circinale CS-541/06]MDB9463060.1 zinc ribbon domain-containing protein [Dolichospermum circinale CS-541/04]MDB9546117.1 zinc ribbon domain-containing protein [Dolichospermum circinale CS-1031]
MIKSPQTKFIRKRRNTPSVRTHVCKCGCILDRDHNAAINILTKALKQTGYDLSTVGRTGTSNACGEMTLYPDWVTIDTKIPVPL